MGRTTETTEAIDAGGFDWLGAATEFKIGDPYVRVVRAKSGGWLVEDGGYWLNNGEWRCDRGEVFPDRNAALTAYQSTLKARGE